MNQSRARAARARDEADTAAARQKLNAVYGLTRAQEAMAALGQTRQGGSSVRHHGGAKARPWCRDGVRARLVMRMARHDATDGSAQRMARPKLGPWPGQVGAWGFEAARATGPCRVECRLILPKFNVFYEKTT